jgi:methylthioribose-1-phosphate isomerase
VTPAALIRGIVTEAGVLSPPFEDSITNAMQKSES